MHTVISDPVIDKRLAIRVDFQFQHFSLNCNLSVFTNK